MNIDPLYGLVEFHPVYRYFDITFPRHHLAEEIVKEAAKATPGVVKLADPNTVDDWGRLPSRLRVWYDEAHNQAEVRNGIIERAKPKLHDLSQSFGQI